MAARSGKEFLERLSASHPTVYVQGEELTGGIAGHPAFRNVVRSYAELFDMQLPFPHAYRRTGTGGQGHGMALS